MSQRGPLVLVESLSTGPHPCPRCRHTGHAVGCPCCTAKAGARREGRQRGRGVTKSPYRARRRNRRKR